LDGLTKLFSSVSN